MTVTQALGLGVVVALGGYLVVLYNGLVSLKHNVSKAWANIDVALKQRHDELPKLIEVCKQYRDFEQSTLQAVIEARGRVQVARESQDVGALNHAEGALRTGLGRIYAVAEAYPDLKANAQFMQLQDRISSLEGLISDRREVYNETVNLNNVGIESFPQVIVARLFGFQPRSLLQFEASETADVDVRGAFKS